MNTLPTSLPYAPLTGKGLLAAAEAAKTSAALPYLQALTDRAVAELGRTSR